MQPNPTPNLLRAAGSRRAGLAGFTLATMALLTLCGMLTLAFADRLDPLERQRRAAEVYRAQQIAGDTYGAAVFRARVGELLPPVVAFLVLIGGAAWGGVALYRYATERRPDERGLVPLLRTERQQAHAALAAYHAARIEEARRPLVPATLHYAPHHELEYRHDGAAQLPGDVAAPFAPSVPSFAQLLDQGRIGKGNPLCLGVDLEAASPIWGDWKDLYSAGLGGKQGSGKSWTAASLIAQSLLSGARVILADPHAGDEESLTTRLTPLLGAVALTADDDKSILAAAHFAHDEFQRRKELAKAKQPYDRTPMILVIDEWTSLIRGDLGAKLPPLLAELTTEGRKYGVNALLLAQRWEAAAAGGSDVRNTLTAHYVHRMRGDEARMMTGLRASALPDDTLSLQPGQAYLFDTRGNVRKIATPTMTPADLGRVAGLLTADAPTMPGFHQASTTTVITPPLETWRKPTGSQMEACAPLASSAAVSAEAARALALFQSGADVAKIVKELRGIDSSAGRNYQTASAEVQALIRQAITSSTGSVA